MSCELCEAINEEYRLIYKDDLVFCTVCKGPLKKGHVIVLPKRHVEKLGDLSSEESKRLFETIDKLKTAIENKYNESAIIHINSGIHSTQKHLHIHILPTKRGLRPMVSSYEGVPERLDISEEEMAEIKKDILEKFKY